MRKITYILLFISTVVLGQRTKTNALPVENTFTAANSFVINKGGTPDTTKQLTGTAVIAKIDQMITDSLNGRGVVTQVDNILDYQTNTWRPYPTGAAKGTIYRGGTDPSNGDSTVAYQGNFEANNLLSSNDIWSASSTGKFGYTSTTWFTGDAVQFSVYVNSAKLLYGRGDKLAIGANNGIPTATLQLDAGNATSTYMKATAGSTTGQTATDGVNYGITGAGVGRINVLENHSLEIFTNNTLSGKFDSAQNLIVTGYIKSAAPPHSLMVFRDSAVTISGGTNVQITNAWDSVYRNLEMDQITYIKGDTQQITVAGAYNIQLQLRGTGANGTDWRVTLAKKTGATTTYSNQCLDFTTTGGTNKNGAGGVFYMEYAANDKVWVVLTRVSGTGDFVAETGQFNIQLYYRE